MRPYKVTPEAVERFKKEREEFKLIYRCTDCVHMKKVDQSCSLGYPNDTLLHAESFLAKDGRFVFCKYFEVD